MKKIITTIALFWCVASYSQVNQVNIVNGTPTEETKKSTEVFINGISTKEDIGGVDIEQPGRRGERFMVYDHFVFTNYNPYPVTVLYKYGEFKKDRPWSKVGTVVIPPAANGKFPSKKVEWGTSHIYKIDIVTITRKVGN